MVMRWPRVRFTVRALMLAVLLVGLLCGGLARWNARRLRQQALMAEMRSQQQATSGTSAQARADLKAAGRTNYSYLTSNSWSLGEWTDRVDAYQASRDGNLPLIVVNLTGGCDDEHLLLIIIRTSGAPLDGPLLDRLTRLYRDRKWRHGVISTPGGARVPGEPSR
jgi:hypothetical protein